MMTTVFRLVLLHLSSVYGGDCKVKFWQRILCQRSMMNECSKNAPPDPVVVMCGQSPVSSLIFGPDETYKVHPIVLSGHENGQIMEWSVVMKRATSSWQGHAESVLWFAWTIPDRLLSQGRDGAVRVWSRDGVGAWTNIGEIPCAQFVFCNFALLRHASHFMLAVPSVDMGHIDVHIIEQSVLTSLPTKTSTESCPMSTLLHSLGPTSAKSYGMCMKLHIFVYKCHQLHLLVAYESGTLTLWDLLDGNLLSEVKAYSDSIMSMDYWTSQDTELVRCITGSADKDLKSWLVEGNKLVEGTSISVTNPGISAISVRTDGRIFASGGWDGRVRIFSVRKLKPLAVLTYHTGSVYCVTFAPDNTLATGSKDGYIALWDVYRNK